MFGCTRPMANNDEYKSLPSLFSYSTQLSAEWKAIATTDQRVYFVNRRTRSSHWFPPPEFWASRHGLPYGWEAALDDKSKKYYINHVTRTTTREDPRSEADQATHLHMTPPQARRIELERDAKIGFGFVAGSEKPVVIRSVIPNGPSHDKLFANDQILKVNGKDVRDAAQADVISLIKSAVGRIELEVVASEDVQDTKNQHSRKSSLMSRATRERRRSTPVSVRFADEPALVQVIGPMEPVRRSSVPLIPNVLKVFLENGQTRSFRYDSNTTAEEIFSSFSLKLDVKLMEHFSLVLSGPKKGQISYIQNSEKIAEIYTNRNCSSVNCLCKLTIAFVPKDHFELLSQDRNTFEYLYAQVTNRVVEGFYGMDLRYDLAIKLAALQIQQKAMETAAGRPVKISVRQVEKEFGGLGKFVSSDLLHNTKEKELRKILDQQIKQNENLASPGERYMSSLQCKLHYLNLAAEMFSYGGRYFDAELVDNGTSEGPSLKKTKKQHVTVLVNLKYGVSQVLRGKVNVLCQLAEFHEIVGFAIRPQENNRRLLRIKLQEGKAIQLICTTLDCLDMIALITGYYKVYVDNTSNTPLPVENEEKWPFAFLREPHNGDVPDFYSKHRVVPDVWSYPSRLQTSNAKRKSQEENPKPQHKDVFIDLSRAPPRYDETAISEEPEEDMTSEKSIGNQTDESTSRQEPLNHGDLPQRNTQSDAKEASVASTDQHEVSGLVLLDEEKELLETASSFLKNNSEDSANDEMESDTFDCGEYDADSDELSASRKRRRVSSGSSGKENVTIKSAKTALGENAEEDQEDLISELILAEAIWQEEKAGLAVVDEHMEQTSPADETDSSVIVCRNYREPDTVDQVDGTFVDVVMEKPVQISTESDNTQSEEVGEDIVISKAVNDYLFACLHSKDYGLGTTDVNQNVIINSYTTTALSGEGANPHLDLSAQHDPFISADPFRDRSPTPSPGDLGFDESKVDNEGIKLADFVECGTASQGTDEQEIVTVTLAGLDEDSGTTGRKSPVPLSNSDEFEFTSDSTSVMNGICGDTKPVDLDNCQDSVASHMVCLEFDDDSDTETESVMSGEDESLWSTFPEYFQPSRRLRYSSSKEAELSLAEEDQALDGLDSTEPDREVALVSVKELSTENESNPKDPVDASNIQDGVSLDWDELSTASSESLECTYEVNAELPSESEEVSEDSGYVNFKEKHVEGVEEICEQREDSNSFPLHIPIVSLGTSKSDKCDIPFDALSSWNDKNSKVDGSTELSSTESTSPVDQESSEKNEIAEISKDISWEEPPRTLSESEHEHDGSSLLFSDSLKHSVLERTGIFSKELPSVKGSKAEAGISDRSYSPSDWIIPSPPSPTPELRETDIRIVPPPPVSPTPAVDELEDELKHLIVPPPPSSVDTLQITSDIKIVSPPPLDGSDNELDGLLYDYDDVRFLSLTDDHKLANNNASSRTFGLNFTEDKKLQAQKVKAEASLMSKEGDYANKSIVFSSRENKTFNPSANSCKTNQIPVKDCSTRCVLKSCSLDSQFSLPKLSPTCSFTLDDSHTKSKRLDRDRRKSGESPNQIELNSSGLDNFADNRGKSDSLKKAASLTTQTTQQSRSRIPSRQKPPVPPKPLIFRAATEEETAEKPIKPLANAEVKHTPLLADSMKKSPKCHPVPLSSIKREALHLSCPDERVIESPTTTEDIPYRNEVSLQREKQGTKRSLSFTCTSPYVPAPYLSSRNQSQYSAQPSDEVTRTSTPHSNSVASAGSPTVPTVNSSLYASSRNAPYSAGNDPSFSRQQPPVMRYAASHLSLQGTNNELDKNRSKDIKNCTLTKTTRESSRLQLSTVTIQEDTPPRPPDTPPPPLPESSPPKMIPGLDIHDFDFGEPLIDELQDGFQSANHEPTTPDLPFRAKDLKLKRFSTSLDNKQENSSSPFTTRREKTYGGTALSRSLTISSLPRDKSQQFSSLDEWFDLDITGTSSLNSLDECDSKSLKTRCTSVCEEGLLKVSVLKKRLEVFLNGEASKPQQPDKAKNWPLIFQNNARFLACDIKVISSSVNRGSPQVVSAVETSLDSLEKLVESCEKTYLMQSDKSNQNDRSFVVITNDVLDQYRDIISTVKFAAGQQPDHPDVEELVKKTNAMAALITSLIRALRKY